MRDKDEGRDSRLQYDTEGNVVARLSRTPAGMWVLIPEPDYPLVYEIETGRLLLWNRKTGKTVKFARGEK